MNLNRGESAIAVCFVISKVHKSVGFEHIFEKINKKHINIKVLLLNNADTDFEKYLIKNNIEVSRINYKNKYDSVLAFIKTLLFYRKNKIKIVHTHLVEASLIGLFAAKLAGVKKRIYTRHHSDYHHKYFPHAVKYDRLVNNLATQIIAVSDSVYSILIEKENVPPKKITIIPHGFKLSEFDNVSDQRINILRSRYNPIYKKPVIGVISRYIELKGIQYIIPAFKKMLLTHPDALLIIANARGVYKIENYLKDLPTGSYKEIEFENDLYALYKLFDIFVHVPTDNTCEAFGQVYVEALASAVPSVFTKSGIANDFIVDNFNAVVVDYKNTDAIYNAILKILNDENFRLKLVANGKQSIKGKFEIETMVSKLEKLYYE